MSISICPYCGNVLPSQDGHCPSCGKPFVAYDWPQEAYSSDGMRSYIQFDGTDGTWRTASNEFIIGREPGQDGYLLPHPSVSREHAKVRFQDGKWEIIRLGKNLLVNGNAVEERSWIDSDDCIQIGPYIFRAKIIYAPIATMNIANGMLCSPKSSFLDIDSDRIYVGGDQQECSIVISGIAPKHCLIYRQNRTKEWWIVDCASESGTRVNGKRVRNERLYEGDEINVAGVSMYFTDTRILFAHDNSQGLSIDLQKCSASAKETKFTILDDVSFHVSPGEFVGVLGPSGCGKSSLIQRIVGLSTFDTGRLLINGHDFNDAKRVFQAKMAYIPQQISLHEELSLQEEVDCFCRLQETGKFIDYTSSQSIIKLVGLENEKDKQIVKLSGGQKRRLSIALELLRSPELLLLDEPTSGLDPATEKSVMTYLRRVANQKRTVICSTHIMENIGLFDKILVLSRGYVVFFGSPDELKRYFNISSPLELYARLGSGDFTEQLQYAKESHKRFLESGTYATQSQKQTELPHYKQGAFTKQIIGYLYRMYMEFISFRHTFGLEANSDNHSIFLKVWNWLKGKKEFFQSSFFIQLLLQPFLIAMVIKLAYAVGFVAGKDGVAASVDIKNLFFFCPVVVFWLGLNNAIRELVHERVPTRCLELLEGIGITSYLSAKVLWTMGMSILQTVLFYAFIRLPIFFSVLNPSTPKHSNPLSLTCFFILCMICITGGLLGLAISSFFKQEKAAIGLLPIIMVPIFFFSHSIVNNSNFGNYVHPSNCICQKCSGKDSKFNNEKANLPFLARQLDRFLPRVLCPRFPESPPPPKVDDMGDVNPGDRGDADYNFYAVYLENLNPCYTPQILMDKLHRQETEQDFNTKSERMSDAWQRVIIVLGAWAFVSLALMCFCQSINEKKWDGR